MATVLTTDERLAIIERDIAALKQGTAIQQNKPNWIDRIKGSFAGDPEFGEILRLGREARKAEQKLEANGDA